MADFPFQRFIDLIALDQNINTLEQKIADIKVQLTKAKEELSLHDISLERSQKTVKEAKKKVDALELELKEYDGQEKEKKERLESASSSVEYAAISKEIDHLKSLQNDLEDTVVEAWRAYETAQKEYQERASTINEHKAVLDAKIQDLMQKQHEAEGQHKDLETQRPHKAKDIPEEWLEKYNIMKKQVSNPVVPMQQDSCSACFYKISQQDLVQLRKRKLLQCKDCYRFLYSKQEEQQDAA